jgi:hypothetical protein
MIVTALTISRKHPPAVAAKARELAAQGEKWPNFINQEVLQRLAADERDLPKVWRELRRRGRSERRGRFMREPRAWTTMLDTDPNRVLADLAARRAAFADLVAQNVVLADLATRDAAYYRKLPDIKLPVPHFRDEAERQEAPFAAVFASAVFFGSHVRGMRKPVRRPDADKLLRDAELLMQHSAEFRRAGDTEVADRLHNRALDLQMQADENPILPDGTLTFKEQGRGDIDARNFCQCMAGVMRDLFGRTMRTSIAHLASAALGRKVPVWAVREWTERRDESEIAKPEMISRTVA